MMSAIPYGQHSLDQADLDAVLDVLNSDWLTQGPMIATFERVVAETCHAQYGVAVCNATAALHLACKALDVGPGDMVWTSPNTFVASANCALFCGASIDFVDICPDTYNMSPQALAEKLEHASRLGRLPKVVIPVHFAGQSCDMRAIKQLADRYGFKIIEDASHAIGAKYEGEPVGSCCYADITVFSFHPVKIITTAEGGMCLTNSQSLAEKIQQFRSHGMTRDANLMTKPSEGDWYYQQLSLGYNYRITDLQCALGVSQMQKLSHFVKLRHQWVGRYHTALRSLPLKLPTTHSNQYSAYHLYVVQVLPEHGVTRKHVFDFLRAHQVNVNVHYIPVHLQPYYTELGFNPGDYPIAERYYQHAITLPLYPDLTVAQHDYVVEQLTAALYA